MREYVLVLFDQKPVEIRIRTYDCDIKNRTRKCHLIDVGTKFDITAEKTTHLGGQAASMDKAQVICSQTTFGYFPTRSNKCSNREFNLVPIQTSRNANRFQNQINFVPFANRHSKTFVDNGAISCHTAECLAERFRRGKHVVQQTYHSKIKILGQVKSEKVVAKGFSNEVKKHNLTADADPNVGVFNLCSRQTSLSEQRLDVDAFSQRPRKCEPRNSPPRRLRLRLN